MRNSMHRHDTGITQPALPIPRKTLIDRLDYFLVRFIKELTRQIKGAISERLAGVVGHGGIVAAVGRGEHSYFLRVAMAPFSNFFAQINQS